MRSTPISPLLAGLLAVAACFLPTSVFADGAVSRPPVIEIDEEAVAAAGIHKLEGKHLTLYSELPLSKVESLADAFDQAFDQWCTYFDVDPREMADWRMTGFLIVDRDKFRRLGLIPPFIPQFREGFGIDGYLWMVDQEDDYRRRQLLLHEGTHGFMLGRFGSCGPPWYMEATAELISMYRIDDEGRITLNDMPRSSEEAPWWGRLLVLRKEYDAGRAKTPDEIMHLPDVVELEDYTWCWALAYFLDRHPRYRQRFHEMPQRVAQRSFTDLFRKQYADDWDQLSEDWQVFLSEFDFGHDVAACEVDYTAQPRQPGANALFEVQADHGWQNSGICVEAGEPYIIEAVGRYQIAEEPRPWISEPNGVTIRYYRGHPRGMLMAGLRSDALNEREETTGLAHPIPVGLRTAFTPETDGTLFFRINESSGELGDNEGKLTVRVRPAEE